MAHPTDIRLTVEGLVPPKKNLLTIRKDKDSGRSYVGPNSDWSAFIQRVTLPLTAAYRRQIEYDDEWEHVACKLYIQILIYPPDNRRRDGDNIVSGVYDLIKGIGLVADDSQFKTLLSDFLPVDKAHPRVEIAVICKEHSPDFHTPLPIFP